MCTPPRGLRGWGCPRRAAGPSVPLSADTVSPPPPPPWLGGGGPACGEERRGDLSSRRGPGPPWLASPPSRASSRRKRPLGGVGPWGVGGVGDGLVPRGGGRGAPAGVVWGCVGSCLRSAVVHRPALGGRCFPAPGRPRRPPLPLRCLPSPPRVRGPCPLPAPPPVALALSGRAARARGRVRGCVRAPGTRAPAATRGTPRRLPAAARSPPGLWPCRGSSPRCARARPVAAVGAGGDKGGGCAVRPSPVWASASPRAPTPPPALPPVHLSGAPAPSVP